MSNNIPIKIGILGENIACKWLNRKNFKILLRNYKKNWGEIDIIAEKGGITHFIEVKSVTHENIDDISRENDIYRPEDNIHTSKIKKISRTIRSYLLEKFEGDEIDWQFDVATVYIDKKRRLAKIIFIEDLAIEG